MHVYPVAMHVYPVAMHVYPVSMQIHNSINDLTSETFPLHIIRMCTISLPDYTLISREAI